MNCLILAYKYRTETMAVCMDRISREANIRDDAKITYAGRLDPMAEGLVIFLVGDFRFNKDAYSKLPKIYQVEFFLGYSTDTYDILGIAQKSSQKVTGELNLLSAIQVFQQPGEFSQKFPPYSSRRVEGKSLFQHARENSDSVPEVSHSVTLHKYNEYQSYEISSDELLEKITTDINRVDGDFRQEESIASWKHILEKNEMIRMHKIVLEVSSGFYVRQWIVDLGAYLSTDAVTFSIKRDTIGVFNMSMLNGESFRVFYGSGPTLNKLTN